MFRCLARHPVPGQADCRGGESVARWRSGEGLGQSVRQFVGIDLMPWQESCRSALCGTLSPAIQHMSCPFPLAAAWAQGMARDTESPGLRSTLEDRQICRCATARASLFVGNSYRKNGIFDRPGAGRSDLRISSPTRCRVAKRRGALGHVSCCIADIKQFVGSAILWRPPKQPILANLHKHGDAPMKACRKFRRFRGDLVNWANLPAVEEIKGPRQVIEQAARDISRGLRDTDLHGIPSNVPGPGVLPERSPGAEVPASGVNVHK